MIKSKYPIAQKIIDNVLDVIDMETYEEPHDD